MSVALWCQRSAALLKAGAQPREIFHDFPARAEPRDAHAIQAMREVSEKLGSPLSDGLLLVADTINSAQKLRDSHSAALAGPRAAARLMRFLPLACAVLGMLLGFNVVGFLFTTLPGIICLIVGAGMTAAASKWNSALIRRASDVDHYRGFPLALVALALHSGVALSKARETVEAVWPLSHEESECLYDALTWSEKTGSPLRRVLDAERHNLLNVEIRRAHALAATLPVSLSAPVALCVLPAFIAWGIVPLLASVMSTSSLTFRSP